MLRRIGRYAVWAIALTAGASASAAPGSAPFDIRGSDTLLEVMTDAFALYKTQCSTQPGYSDLTYLGSGSGNGEKAMTRDTTYSAGPWQLIAPMSRNLNAGALTRCPKCAAELRNVLGMDAGVFIEKTSGTGGYVRAPTFDLGTASSDPHFAPADSFMGLILGGKGGTGTREACRDPARVAAIATVQGLFGGVTGFTHFYRRDDNSGTSDTFREKLQLQRYCNGTAPGTGGVNTGNQDLDPLRFPCPPADATHAAVSCTYTDPTQSHFGSSCTAACTSASCPADCTAGFLIALSRPDPNFPDVTTTIGNRVGSDSSKSTLGYAGRESVRYTGTPSSGPRINGTSFIDTNVRSNSYMLSRRLWLQDRIYNDATGEVLNSYAAGSNPSCANANSTALPAHSPDAGCFTRDLAEGSQDNNGTTTGFFFWATDSGFLTQSCANNKSGRQIMGPILRAHGYLSCMPDDSDPPPTGNLCSLLDGPGGTSYAPGAGAPAATLVNPITSGAYAPVACTAGQICWSDGSTCPTGGGTCPVPPARPAGWICFANSECTTGTCDAFSSTCL